MQGSPVPSTAAPGSPTPSGASVGQSSPLSTGFVPGMHPPPLIVIDSRREDRGPHDPVHEDPPSAGDIESTNALKESLQVTVESVKEGEDRKNVLIRLEKLMQTWMGKLLNAKGYERPDDHGGRLLCFGSYALGVHFPGADIDTLCIAPRDVDREDFFESLVKIMKRHTLVKELNPVRDAHVPVIKMKFADIQIDLVFSSLDLERIPPSPPFNIGADSLLRNLDDASQRSINGTRVAEKLLRCVPCVDTFRTALRGIKLWAKNRGIYGNIYGFPGGVAWAIMTAAICQLFPKSPPSVVLRNFFRHYRANVKEDGSNNPVYLTRSLEVATEIGKKSWDRKTAQYELMPVITPMPPYMNSSYNISRSTISTLCQEFARGDEVLEQQEKVGGGQITDWTPLWEVNEFFLTYRAFVQISVSALDNSSFNSWVAFVESKVRHLVQLLDSWPQYSELHEIAKTSDMLELRTWPELFQQLEPPPTVDATHEEACATPTADGDNSPQPATPHSPEDMQGEGTVNGMFYIGIGSGEQSVDEGHSRQIVDFEGAIMQFYQQLLWVGKTDKMLTPSITIVKRSQIPEWVMPPQVVAEIRKKETDYQARAGAKRKAREEARELKRARARTDTDGSLPMQPSGTSSAADDMGEGTSPPRAPCAPGESTQTSTSSAEPMQTDTQSTPTPNA